MKPIERHDIQRDDADQLLREIYEDFPGEFDRVSRTMGDEGELYGLEHSGQALAEFGVVAGIARSEIRRGLRIKADCVAALFEMVTHHGKRIVVSIDDREIELSSVRPHGQGHCVAWAAGFVTASAVRDERARAALLAVTDETMFYARSTRAVEEYQLAFFTALRAMGRNDRDTPDRFARALDLVRPENARATPADELARDAHAIALAEAIHRGDAAGVNAALEATLLAHRAYWEADTKRRQSPDGFLALDALGLAAIAHDRGLPVEVESDYMPAWIVRAER